MTLQSKGLRKTEHHFNSYKSYKKTQSPLQVMKNENCIQKSMKPCFQNLKVPNLLKSAENQVCRSGFNLNQMEQIFLVFKIYH